MTVNKERELLVSSRDSLEDALLNCHEWRISCETAKQKIDNYFEELDDGIFEEQHDV